MVSAADRYLITDRGREKAVYTIKHILCAADLYGHTPAKTPPTHNGDTEKGSHSQQSAILKCQCKRKNNQREEEKHLEKPPRLSDNTLSFLII